MIEKFEVGGQQHDYADTNIAPLFSTSINYNVGDYVLYNTITNNQSNCKLYRFITSKNAGAWDNDAVTEVSSAGDTDATLSVFGMAADAGVVGDALVFDRPNIILDSMAKYTGAELTSVREIPDNTWISRNGSILQENNLLGSNFIWDLNPSTGYIIKKRRISSSNVHYEISPLGGSVLWTGFESSATTDINWYSHQLDQNLNDSGRPADAGAVKEQMELLQGENLHNPNTDTYGYCINSSGQIVELSGGSYTDFISVSSDKEYELWYENSSPSDTALYTRIVEYNNNNEFLRSSFYQKFPAGSGHIIFKTNQDASKIRISPTSTRITIRLLRINSFESSGTAIDTIARSILSDGTKPIYVAIGTSVTRGEIHRNGQDTVIADWPYPQYFGKLNNMEVYNLAQGGTGCVRRGANGNKQNFMDVIAANEDLIRKASLITIEWGGNDSAFLSYRIGSVTDYFNYEKALSQIDPYTYMQNNATELGALNWCINRIYELNQVVTLILITTFGPGGMEVSIDKNNGVITYSTQSETSWANKVKQASRALLEVTAIPTINCDDGYFMTAYNHKNNPNDLETMVRGSDGTHLTNTGYLMKARYMCNHISNYFRH